MFCYPNFSPRYPSRWLGCLMTRMTWLVLPKSMSCLFLWPCHCFARLPTSTQRSREVSQDPEDTSKPGWHANSHTQTSSLTAATFFHMETHCSILMTILKTFVFLHWSCRQLIAKMLHRTQPAVKIPWWGWQIQKSFGYPSTFSHLILIPRHNQKG